MCFTVTIAKCRLRDTAFVSDRCNSSFTSEHEVKTGLISISEESICPVITGLEVRLGTSTTNMKN